MQRKWNYVFEIKLGYDDHSCQLKKLAKLFINKRTNILALAAKTLAKMVKIDSKSL